MNGMSFLIKPVSGRCNLACRYCFYRDELERRESGDRGLMSEETAKLLIDRAFELPADSLNFAFQGGEPTLAGLPFFERFVEAVRSRAAENDGRPARHVSFSLQTNGTVLDAEWARFLRREEFLVGVSVDGPRLLHDAFRPDRAGAGTYARVMRGVEALRAEGVPINALCVVNEAAADNAALVYRHLRSKGFEWIQFIPCLDPVGGMPGETAWSLDPERYGRFLKTTFDLRFEEWRAGVPVGIRWFDNLVRMAADLPPESCGMAGSCAVSFTVEADGSVYPCDFYCTDEWRLGNVRTASFTAMRDCPTALRFVESSRHSAPECGSCSVYPLCRGGCRRDREPFVNGLPGPNRLCPAFRQFFEYAGERIRLMATEELRARAVHAQASGSFEDSFHDTTGSRAALGSCHTPRSVRSSDRSASIRSRS